MGKNEENLWLSRISAEKIVGCEHIEMLNNPLQSTTTNIMIQCHNGICLVVEEGKIKLICAKCVRLTVYSVPIFKGSGSH